MNFCCLGRVTLDDEEEEGEGEREEGPCEWVDRDVEAGDWAEEDAMGIRCFCDEADFGRGIWT